MGNRNITILFGLLITAALIFTGCSNVLAPSVQQTDGTGTVKVSFSAGFSGRTLLPSKLDFDRYDFTFTSDSYNETFSGIMDAGGVFAFNLPVGSGYSLHVEAFKNGVDEAAAEGFSESTFNVQGPTTNVQVRLL